MTQTNFFRKEMGKLYRFEGDFTVITEVHLIGNAAKTYINICSDVVKPDGESLGIHVVSIAEHQYNDFVDLLRETLNVALTLIDHEGN